MNNQERLERYLELCMRTYERMLKDGTWPWRHSDHQTEPVVESEDVK